MNLNIYTKTFIRPSPSDHGEHIDMRLWIYSPIITIK